MNSFDWIVEVILIGCGLFVLVSASCCCCIHVHCPSFELKSIQLKYLRNGLGRNLELGTFPCEYGFYLLSDDPCQLSVLREILLQLCDFQAQFLDCLGYRGRKIHVALSHLQLLNLVLMTLLHREVELNVFLVSQLELF